MRLRQSCGRSRLILTRIQQNSSRRSRRPSKLSMRQLHVCGGCACVRRLLRRVLTASVEAVVSDSNFRVLDTSSLNDNTGQSLSLSLFLSLYLYVCIYKRVSSKAVLARDKYFLVSNKPPPLKPSKLSMRR